MITGDFFTAPVERLAAGGAGLVHIDGQTVFVDYTAPGDLISLRITEVHTTWARGELQAVLEPSADRRTPACSRYGTCGGCSLQHLNYPAQLREKEGILKEALIRIGGISCPPPVKTVPSPEYGYRNRVQFHRIPGTNRLGFKARKSGNILPLKDCPVADEGIRQALGAKPHTILPPPGKRRFTVYSRRGVLLCEGKDGPAPVGLHNRNILMDPGVFFQSNAAALETLIPDLCAASDRADPSRPMADIYCGVGTFAAFLGERFSRIDLVEADTAALDLARKNVPGSLMRYFPRTDEEWVKEIRRSPSSCYGFAVADPPRKGLSPSLRQWLGKEGPPLLAYVSCDPATLARDSAVLRAGGYELESTTFYDFYPQTPHIETLAIFVRPVKSRISLYGLRKVSQAPRGANSHESL
ncbi:MAG: class I SAM-dependent RNA methyltransferase [Treponema sp.]|jgi:23S rRNA (uracil1939-C5)-methyltransferase|nr:class I SAM-dependent RNA methyltransferase [Treponema sp.]